MEEVTKILVTSIKRLKIINQYITSKPLEKTLIDALKFYQTILLDINKEALNRISGIVGFLNDFSTNLKINELDEKSLINLLISTLKQDNQKLTTILEEKYSNYLKKIITFNEFLVSKLVAYND